MQKVQPLPRAAVVERPPRPFAHISKTIGKRDSRSKSPKTGKYQKNSPKNSDAPLRQTSDSSIATCEGSPSSRTSGTNAQKVSFKLVHEARRKEKRRRKSLRPAVASLFKVVRSTCAVVEEMEVETSVEIEETEKETLDEDETEAADFEANDAETDNVEVEVVEELGAQPVATKTPLGLDARQVAEVFSRLGCYCTDLEVEQFLAAYGHHGNGRIRQEEFMSYVLGWWHLDDVAYVAWSDRQDAAHCEQPFEDVDFPPSEDIMLGDGCPGRVKNCSVVFPRCSEILGEGQEISLFRCLSSFELQNICQGVLLNCWLMAAIACVAEYPGQIQSLFRTKSISAIGRYEVQLYDVIIRKWRVIELDDRMPCTDNGQTADGPRYQPLFAKLWSGELWLPLLEKAVAKYVGSYGELMRGNAGFAFQLLTGCDPNKLWALGKLRVTGRRDSEGVESVGLIASGTIAESRGSKSSVRISRMSTASTSTGVDMSGSEEFASGTIVDSEQWDHKIVSFPDRSPHGREERRGMLGTIGTELLWQKLCMWRKKHFLITAATSGKSESIGTEGLIRGHCYSIFAIVEAMADGEDHRMVQLRNPWRRSVEWQGRFSNSWEDWDQYPELQVVLLPFQRKSMFWMAFNDFVVYFTSLIVCTLPMMVGPTCNSTIIRCRRPPNMLQQPAKTLHKFVTLFADFDIKGQNRVGPRGLMAILRSLGAYVETDTTYQTLVKAEAASEIAKANSEKFDFATFIFWLRSIVPHVQNFEAVGTAGKWRILERQSASVDHMAPRERNFEIELEVELGQISGSTIGLPRNFNVVGQKTGLEVSFGLTNKAGVIERRYVCQFADSLHAYAEGTWSTEEGASKSGSFVMASLRPKPLDLKKLGDVRSDEFNKMSMPAAEQGNVDNDCNEQRVADLDIFSLNDCIHEGIREESLGGNLQYGPLEIVERGLVRKGVSEELLLRLDAIEQTFATSKLGSVPKTLEKKDTASYDACVNRLNRFLEALGNSGDNVSE